MECENHKEVLDLKPGRMWQLLQQPGHIPMGTVWPHRLRPSLLLRVCSQQITSMQTLVVCGETQSTCGGCAWISECSFWEDDAQEGDCFMQLIVGAPALGHELLEEGRRRSEGQGRMRIKLG